MTPRQADAADLPPVTTPMFELVRIPVKMNTDSGGT